jgi:hypothetical protein
MTISLNPNQIDLLHHIFSTEVSGFRFLSVYERTPEGLQNMSVLIGHGLIERDKTLSVNSALFVQDSSFECWKVTKAGRTFISDYHHMQT